MGPLLERFRSIRRISREPSSSSNFVVFKPVEGSEAFTRVKLDVGTRTTISKGNGLEVSIQVAGRTNARIIRMQDDGKHTTHDWEFGSKKGDVELTVSSHGWLAPGENVLVPGVNLNAKGTVIRGPEGIVGYGNVSSKEIQQPAVGIYEKPNIGKSKDNEVATITPIRRVS